MSSSMHTILVIGGTSGIGEAFVKRWHSMGKKIITTGRRENRLNDLKASLPGLETFVWDNSDLAAIPTHVFTLFKKYPDIDTVWVNSGMQYPSSIKDPTSSSDEKYIHEITVNITAPLLIARHSIPFLLAKQAETNFLITSSGLAFTPAGLYPVYCPTKAAIHSYMVGIRQSLHDTNVNVIEIVPPAVQTDLADFSKVPGVMELDDYVNETFEKLEKPAKELKEVAAGSAQPRVDLWRAGPGKWLAEKKMGG